MKPIKPMKARGKFHEGLWVDDAYVVEEKYDGHRATAYFGPSVVRFFSSRESVKGGLTENTAKIPHLAARPTKELVGTVLDGELIALPPGKYPKDHEGGSKFVGAILNSKPEEAIRKQEERGYLHFVAFDCLFHKGVDMRGVILYRRRYVLEKVIAAWQEFSPWRTHLHLAEQWEAKWELYNEIVEAGGEGVVLKRLNSVYGDQSAWVKKKFQATADCVIKGFEAPKASSVKKGDTEKTATKYAKAGLIGAVVLGQYDPASLPMKQMPLREVATVSGFPDTLRADMTKHPEQYVGRVARIKHNGREPTGRFRHPRWDCLRDDKHAKDCIFDLEES